MKVNELTNCRVIDVVQGSPEWLEWRKTGVTATCTPVLLKKPGATKTPYQLYLEYASLISPPDLSVIKQVAAGKKLEPIARLYLENRFGDIALPFCVQSKEYPFMIASLDGITSEGVVTEIKNLSKANHLALLEATGPDSNYDNSEHIMYYRWQVIHQIVAAGVEKGIILFYSTTDTSVLVPVSPSEEEKQLVIDTCRDFWEHLKKKEIMPFDKEKDIVLFSDANIMKHHHVSESFYTMIPRIQEIACRYQTIKNDFDKIAASKKAVEDELKELVHEFATEIGYSKDDPVRIDGYGLRYLENKVHGGVNWKKVAEAAEISPDNYPDCVNKDKVVTSITCYDYVPSADDVLIMPDKDSDEESEVYVFI